MNSFITLNYFCEEDTRYYRIRYFVFPLSFRQTIAMAQLLAKFRIDFSDVIIIPDVTKKADPATKAEFEELISGCDIDTGELNSEREKTNRYYAMLYKSISHFK